MGDILRHAAANVAMNFGLQTCSIGELDRRAHISQFQIVHKLVIAGKSARRTGKLAGIVPVEQLANRTPFVAALDDRVANFQKSRRLWVPESRRSETTSGFEMQIEAGRMNVLAAM